MDKKIFYRFVRNTKEEIDKKPINDGAIYFDTTHHNIYMDKDNHRDRYSVGQAENIIGIKKEASGNPIVINDSADFNILVDDNKEVTLANGSTTQNPIRHLSGSVISADNVSGGQVCPTKVESVNKIKYPWQETTVTAKGITFTDNGDGTLTLNGTSTEGVTFFFFDEFMKDIPFEVGKTYHLNAFGSVETAYIFVNYTDLDGTPANASTSIGNLNFTVEENWRSIIAYVYIPSGNTLNNLVVKPMISEGKSEKPFTPPVTDLSQSKLNVCGTNLLPTKYAYGNISTNNGITYTVNDDGSVTLDGTATKRSVYIFAYENKAVNGDITITSNGFKENSGVSYGIYINGVIDYCTLTRGERHFNNVTKMGQCYIEVSGGVTFNNERVTVQIENSKTASPYEKPIEFTYPVQADGTVNNVQSVSPSMTMLCDKDGLSIDTILTEPIVNGEFQKIGDNGKNLFSENIITNGEVVTYNGVKCWKGIDGSNPPTIKLACKHKGSLIVYLSSYRDKEQESEIIYSQVIYTDGTRSKAITSNHGKVKIFETDPLKTVDYINFRYNYGHTMYIDLENSYISFSEGYEPYKGSTLTLSQKYKLSEWDSIFRDSDGLWKKKIKTRIRTLNGDSIGSWVDSSDPNIWSFRDTEDKKIGETNVYCDKFKYAKNAWVYANAEGTFSGHTALTYLYFVFPKSVKDRETLIKWLNENPIEVQYELETSIYETLPEADQLMLNSLETFYPNTVMQTDEGVILNVKYLADTKNYIDSFDKQITDLRKAIVASKGQNL